MAHFSSERAWSPWKLIRSWWFQNSSCTKQEGAICLYIAHLQLLGMWNYHDEWWEILETTLKPPIEHCSTVLHSNKSAETETSLKFTSAKKSQTTGSNLLCFSANKKMASAFEWTRHCFIPLGVSFIKVTSSSTLTVDASSIPAFGLTRLRGECTAMMAMPSIKLFPRLGKEGLTWHLESWLNDTHQKHLQEMYGDVVFFSKLASSRPKFPKTPARKSCHTEEFGFKKRSNKWKHLPLSKFSSLIIFCCVLNIVFCQTMDQQNLKDCFRDQKHTAHLPPAIYPLSNDWCCAELYEKAPGPRQPSTLQDILHPRED